MPDTKITALTAIGANPIIPSTFPIPMVDLTDTSMAASGTTKKVTVNQILGAGGTATLASATITGDLTVDTSTLKVDSANNRVGIGTATPDSLLQMAGAGTINWKLSNTADSVTVGAYAGTTTGTTGTVSNHPFFLFTNNTERYRLASDGVATWSNVGGVAGTAMTLNSTGLGVGVASPTNKLNLATSSGSCIAGMTNGTNSCQYAIDSTGPYIYSITGGAQSLRVLAPTGSPVFTIDGTGNVGIGVTPSAWSTGKALEISSAGNALWSGTGYTALMQNAVQNSGYKYGTTNPAARYDVAAGTHAWFTAPSGTAGTTITDFATAKMTLDASGNLLVGTTSSPSGAKVGAITKLSGVSAEGTAAINVSTTPVAISRNTGVCGLFFVMGYNASGGAQGWYLVASTGSGTPTVISSGGTPGLTLTFTMAGGQLNAQTASGTFVANAFSITA